MKRKVTKKINENLSHANAQKASKPISFANCQQLCEILMTQLKFLIPKAEIEDIW